MHLKRILPLILLITTLSVQAQEKDGWTLSTTQTGDYAGITLANGYIGMVTSEHLFTTNDIILNGTYEYHDGYDGVSTAVFSPNFLNLTLKLDGKKVNDGDATNWCQWLNMKEATVTTEFDLPAAHVRYTQQAMRNLPYMGFMVVEITQ